MRSCEQLGPPTRNKNRAIASVLCDIAQTRGIIAEALPELKAFLMPETAIILGTSMFKRYFAEEEDGHVSREMSESTFHLRNSRIVLAGSFEHRYEFGVANRKSEESEALAMRYLSTEKTKSVLSCVYLPKIEKRSSLDAFDYQSVQENPIGLIWALVATKNPESAHVPKNAMHKMLHDGAMKLREDLLFAMRNSGWNERFPAHNADLMNGFQALVSLVESSPGTVSATNMERWMDHGGNSVSGVVEYAAELGLMDRNEPPIVSFTASPDLRLLFPGPIACVDSTVSWRNTIACKYKETDKNDTILWTETCMEICNVLLEMTSMQRDKVIADIHMFSNEARRLVAVIKATTDIFALDLLESAL